MSMHLFILCISEAEYSVGTNIVPTNVKCGQTEPYMSGKEQKDTGDQS